MSLFPSLLCLFGLLASISSATSATSTSKDNERRLDEDEQQQLAFLIGQPTFRAPNFGQGVIVSSTEAIGVTSAYSDVTFMTATTPTIVDLTSTDSGLNFGGLGPNGLSLTSANGVDYLFVPEYDNIRQANVFVYMQGYTAPVLTIPDPDFPVGATVASSFGWSTCAQDRFLVIGANTAGGTTINDNTGAAYLYELTLNDASSPDAFSLVDEVGVFGLKSDSTCLTASTCGASLFGTSCAILLDDDLSTIAVSSPSLVNRGSLITLKAQVDLFLTDSSTPSLANPTNILTIPSPGQNGDNFGWALSVAKISGKNVLAIGAPGVNLDNLPSTSGAGLVYLYSYSLEDYKWQATLSPPSSYALSSFGWQVNLLPSHLIVSASAFTYRGNGDGAVFVTRIDGDSLGNDNDYFTDSDNNYQVLTPVAAGASGNFGYSTSVAILGPEEGANAELVVGEPHATFQYTNLAGGPGGNVYSYIIPLSTNEKGGGGGAKPRAGPKRQQGPIAALGAACGLAVVGLGAGTFFVAKKIWPNKGFVPLASTELVGKQERL